MEFRVLGPVDLTIDGVSVPVRSPLQRALLAMLVNSANRVVTIDRIVDALWRSADWEAGHRRLWFHVSKLRARLADDGSVAIERSGPGYRLRVDEADIDAERFCALVDDATASAADDPDLTAQVVRSALSLWRGAPYADVDEDAVGQAERVRLERRHLAALELWADAELSAGRPRQVIGELERMIIAHPYREQLRGQLMRALWGDGHPAEALAAFEATRAILADELGAEPSAALRDLAARIAADTARTAAAPSRTVGRPGAVATASNRYGGDRFVARTAELEALTGAVRAAADGRVAARTVQGQAGSGKTRLLRELVDRAEADVYDLVAMRVACHAGTGPDDAFGPFRDVARLLDGTGAPAGTATPEATRRVASRTGVAAVASEALAGMDRSGPAAAVGAIADALRRAFDALASDGPVLLVIDDAQWIDGASIDVVRRLMTHSARVAVVLAYRGHDLGDGGDGRGVRALERDLQSNDGAAVLVDLDRTTPEARRRFVDALLDREDNAFDDGFRATVTDRSEGHALFAVELIDELRRRGTIRRDRAGAWSHVDAAGTAGWPRRIEAVLGSRFAQVDLKVLRLLRAASVEGETFTTAVVSGICAVPESDVVALLSHSAVAVHQIVEAVGPTRIGHTATYRYRFRHNLFQRYVRDHLDPVERAALHADVAACLSALTSDDEWAVTLAHHHELAGDADRAVHQLGRAARRAIRLAANAQAIEHIDRALRLLQCLPADVDRDRREAELLVQLGIARGIVHGFSSPLVEEVYARSAALLDGAAPERRFPALFGLWMTTASAADFARSTPLADELEATAAAAEDDGLRLMALHARWTDRALFGDIVGCLEAADAGRALYRHERHHPLCYRYGNHDPAVCALSLGAVMAAIGGDTARAQRDVADGGALAEVLDHRPSRVQALAMRAWVAQLVGEPEAVRDAAERALALEADGPVPLWFGLVRLLRAWVDVTQGTDTAALDTMAREVEVQRSSRSLSWMPCFGALYADALLAAGQPDAAHRIVVETTDATRPFYRCEAPRVAGEAAIAHGRSDRALMLLVRAVDQGLRDGALMLALRAAVALGRVDGEDGTAAVARVLDHLPAGHRSGNLAAARAALPA